MVGFVVMDKDKAKQKIKELVVKYESEKAAGVLCRYSEDDTKRIFIMPLFEALGWDVWEKREVSSEEHIKGAGRPDYAFKLNGITRFYLEAKKISADLDDEEFAFQVVNYAWNKTVTYAVLTDFEGIKVFNSERIDRLHLIDKLVFELPCKDYEKEFETLRLLSKDSIGKGELDAWAEKNGKKDKKILVHNVVKKLNEDLSWCRERLTTALVDCNKDKKISTDLLDEGVQKLFDRLIFLRVAEDRKIESNILLNLTREARTTTDGSKIFQAMTSKFRELDKLYNSNLFTEHPFEHWNEHAGATEEVIKHLYGKPNSYKYDFSAMPTDVLGSVYENYLSHRLNQSKKGVSVKENARMRKEQGIYYTPSFVVDYIVRNALKPLLDKCRSISDLKKIKILDPACGSGSFLIKALEVMNEKYREFGNPGNEFTKLEILRSNIFGVDLDSQAVEIARLNLLVSALEKPMPMPPLTENIKKGNSLIFGAGKDAFNWREEFSEVFKQGGFDVIIGNPPYIKEFVNKSAFDDLHDSPYYQGKMDIWTMFGCVSIDLLKDDGALGFIAPNNWVANAGASIFRDKILKDGELKTFIDFGDYKVFEQAGIQTMIFIFEKRKPSKKYTVDYIRILNRDIKEVDLVNSIYEGKMKIEIEPEKLLGKNITFSTSESGSIFDKIQSKKNFELTEKEVAQGIVADPDKAFIFSGDEKFSNAEQERLKKYFTSVARYFSGERRGLIAYLDKSKNYDIEKLPRIKNQLLEYKKELDNRREVKNGRLNWFNLHWPRDEMFFTVGSKIIGGIRVKQPSFYYTEEQYYGSRALNFIKTERINLKYLTGILNSKLVFFWLKNKGKQLGDLLQVDKGPLMEIPICVGDKEQQKTIITLVDKMLFLNKELRELSENSEKWLSVKSEIEKTDRKIDEEVYKLYGLTEEEIKIVENK